MYNATETGAYSPAEEDIAQSLVAFLLRCSETKPQYDNPQLMSEITAKRLLQGLRRSGFVLMKQAATPERSPTPRQPYLL